MSWELRTRRGVQYYMDYQFQFETPRSSKSRYLFWGSIAVALLLWPVLHWLINATPRLIH